MSNYLRFRVPGGLYFFTVVTAGRQPLLIEHVDKLRLAFRPVRDRHPFRIEAAVILPDHLHCVWQLPDGDADFSSRWRLIKSAFSRALRPATNGYHRKDCGERNIWQRRFWEHALRDETDVAAHVDYIHYNPVKHGHVLRPCDWGHSTFKQFVENGVYEMTWGEAGIRSDLAVE